MSILQSQKLDLPECPHALLPDPLRQFVIEAAACKSAPVDYVFAALLAASSALIGNARRVCVWYGWFEPTALWFALVGNPSCNKSPALDAVISPLNKLEADLRKLRGGGAISAYSGDKCEADTHQPLPRLLVKDATIQAIAILLAENPKGLFFSVDELAGLLANLERTNGSDRPFYLEAFGGRPTTVDRVKYDKPIFVPSVLLSMIGSIQPQKLDELLLKQPDDGLASRFIYIRGEAVPVTQPEKQPDDDMLERVFKRLSDLQVPMNDNGLPQPEIIKMCSEGQKLMQESTHLTRFVLDLR